LPLLLPLLLPLSGAPARAGEGLPAGIHETWDGRAPPVVGQGNAALTVVVRGARTDIPVTAAIGDRRGELEHLGLSVFALTLRGVPAEGELRVEVGEQLAWRGTVRSRIDPAPGEGAVVLLNTHGRRLERLPAAMEDPAAPPSRSWLLPAAWLSLCGLALTWARRASV